MILEVVFRPYPRWNLPSPADTHGGLYRLKKAKANQEPDGFRHRQAQQEVQANTKQDLDNDQGCSNPYFTKIMSSPAILLHRLIGGFTPSTSVSINSTLGGDVFLG